jgi:undecaprenyl diphosphate synthase
MSVTDKAAPPAHIAVIMDGNGRWAKRRGLPRHAGHKAGLSTARRIIELCAQRGVQALTLFTFSSENWQRPVGEISSIMDLFLSALGKDMQDMHRNGVRTRFIGDRSGFSLKLQQSMRDGEELTARNPGLMLNIAVGYGGRWDILQAVRKLAREAMTGTCQPEQIDELRFAENLALAPLPDPDLFIRTGGEQRISNFLIWNLAYCELYFTDVLWPDFDTPAFDQALAWYATRQRRFGMTGEQLQSAADA